MFASNKYLEGIGVRGKKWHKRKRSGRGGPEAEELKKNDKRRRS